MGGKRNTHSGGEEFIPDFRRRICLDHLAVRERITLRCIINDDCMSS
jgi:hypothetical protein